jgi:hypothetical protein
MRYGAENFFVNGDELLSGDFVVPANISNIPKYAFYGYNGFTSVTIPSTVKKIDERAFGATGTSRFVIEDTTSLSLGNYFMQGAECLTDVIIGEGVKSLPTGAFYACIKLANVSLPESMQSIGADAFGDCTDLESISIPKNVKSMSAKTFLGSTGLKNIIVDADNMTYQSIDGVLYSKDGTKLVCYPAGREDETFIVPNEVTTIENSAFEQCQNLKHIILSEGITTISSYAFYQAVMLSTVTLPTSLAKIDTSAFGYCKAITAVNYHGSAEQWSGISIATGNNYLTGATINYNYVAEE